MAFHEVFSDLRKRRRIPMRLFEEEAQVSRSYIHGVEQGKLLPSPEKLDGLVSVFVRVAEEQEADPEADAQKLYYERERTAVIDRLGFDPELADALVSMRNLNEQQRADLAIPLVEALKLFRRLNAKERSALGPFIGEMVEFFEQLDPSRWQEIVVKLYEAFYAVRTEAEAGKEPQKKRKKSAKRLDRSKAAVTP